VDDIQVLLTYRYWSKLRGNSLFVAGWPTKASFWSGGDFGPEAAGWTAVVLAIGLGLTVFARRRSLT